MTPFDFCKAVRDAADLTTGQKALLWTMATYMPNVWPSAQVLAEGASLNVSTVRSMLRKLEKAGWLQRHHRKGKSTIFTLAAPTNPGASDPRVSEGRVSDPRVSHTTHPGASEHRGGSASGTTEQSKNRQRTDKQSKSSAENGLTDSHAGLVELDSDLLVEEQTATVTPPPIPADPPSWMDKWADAWSQVCGHIPMPPIAQIEGMNCDELRFAAALARVASMKHGGQLRSARKAFFGTLRKLAEKEDHEISAWTPAGVLQELEGEKVKTSTVPYHRPAAPVTPELTEEQREANRAVMRQWVMTPSGDFLHVDSPEYKQYQEALARRGVAA